MKSRIIFLISIICLFLAGPVLAEETITIDVAQDAAIKSASPNTNLNGDWLFISPDNKAYIQFDFSQYAGTVLSIANLEFNFNASYARNAQIYLITGDGADDWDESTITWNNAPGNDTSSTAYYLNDATFTATLLGSIEQPASGGSSTVGFLWDNEALKTNLINELNTGDRKATLAFSRNSTSRFAQYACKENVGYHPVRIDATFDTLALAGNRMTAEPETREVYAAGEVIDTATEDPETARIAFTSTGIPLYDGNLILAFKLPALPAGKVISSATFNWFYVGHGSRAYPAHDLYGLPFKTAASTPVLNTDFYVGANDTAALRIATDVTDFDAQGQWQMTNTESKRLAAYLQAQYDNGAVENDWALLRFNPVSMMNLYVLNTIKGPNASDPTLRPYIELEFADASEGYWKPVTVSTDAANIIASGVTTAQPDFYVGSTTVDDTTQAIEAIFPFEFPELASNEYVNAVAFAIEASNPYGFPGRYFDIDMYGLDYRSSSSFESSDYFVGAYALLPAEGLNGTPISSALTEDYVSSQPAMVGLDADASSRAACYINAQKAAGATSSDYGFFRLNPRYVTLWYTRQVFSTPELAVRVVTTQPTCLPTPDTEYACPMIGYEDYPVSDQDGDCMVTLADLKLVLSGWLTCTAEPASYYCP
ncbi:MAG: DNRLRE domain-containing protein [Sedimentisphaeraceae bacterium JB056]